MTEPAAVGYLGVAAMVTAVCAAVCLVAAAISAAIDRRPVPTDRRDTHEQH
jgi:hypothetical protein